MKIIRPLAITDSILYSSNVPETDAAAYSASVVYPTGTKALYISTNIHKVYESVTGSSSSVTMTIASPCVVSWIAHGLAAGTPISFSTTGSLPTGIVANTVYYVLSPTTDSFNISATVGGGAINTSGSQSGIHTTKASSNYNKAVTDTTYWLDTGSDNRWKSFDQSVTSQTSNPDSIANVFHTTGRIDSVAVLNIFASSMTVTQTDAVDGVVFNQTYNLISDSGITDWYAYFTEDILRIQDKVVTGLYPYADSTISVSLTASGESVLCGGMILGQSKDISYMSGATHVGIERSAKLNIQDYSIKTVDDFGNYTILERSFSKRANFTVYLENSYVDSLQVLLAGYRAVPVVYVGSGNYGSTAIYGFYKDFSIDLASSATKSICTIEIEGIA